MSDSVIERGLPIPESKRKTIEMEYPEILLLEVGDSFVAKEPCGGFHISVALFGINNKQMHEVCKVDGEDSYRVWRVR
jgi:hypothetical protein